jgi:hypothetical protein
MPPKKKLGPGVVVNGGQEPHNTQQISPARRARSKSQTNNNNVPQKNELIIHHKTRPTFGCQKCGVK